VLWRGAVGVIVESWDGFKWWIDEREESDDRLVLSKGELSVLKTLYGLARGSEVFADVGAHVGYYAVRMARCYKRVHAFEPNPMSVEKLKRNLELNGITNATVHPYALGDREEVRTLHLAGASSSFHAPPVSPHAHRGAVEVLVKRMDDVLERADAVKIDVEGWEERVIEGMRNIIERWRPALVVEHHEFRGYRVGTFERIRGSLKSAGYVPIPLTGAHVLYYHRSKPVELIEYPVYLAWVNHCVANIERGLPWYYGLPRTWWWGMSFVDFVQELGEHVAEEPEWIELIIAGKVNTP